MGLIFNLPQRKSANEYTLFFMELIYNEIKEA